MIGNQKKYFLTSLFTILTVVVLDVLFNAGVDFSAYKYLLSLIVFETFVINAIIAQNKYGTLSIQFLFLTCMFLFNYGRVLMYLIGQFDYANSAYSIFNIFKWKNDIIVSVNHYYLIFNLVFMLGLSWHMPKRIVCANAFNNYKPVLRIVKWIFYIISPIVAFNYLRMALVLVTIGYGGLYNGEIYNNFNMGILFKLFRVGFSVVFYTICMLEEDEKQFTRCGLIYIAVTGVQLIQGSRGAFIASILIFLYTRCRRFGKTVRAKRLLLYVLIFFPLIYLVACIRDGQLSSFNIFDSFKYALIDMSGSFNVPAFYQQNRGAMKTGAVPYILDPLIRLYNTIRYANIYNGGQTADYYQVTSNLGHIMTYYISPTYYLAGNNVASNFLAEWSQFGYIGVGIGSALTAWMINFYDDNYDRNMFLRFMSIEFLSKILYLPRAEMFYDTYNLFKFGLIYILIKTIIISVGKKRSYN